MSSPRKPATPPSDARIPAASTVTAASPLVWANQELHEEPDGDSAFDDDMSNLTASLSSSIFRYRTVNGRTYHSERGNLQYYAANDEKQKESMDVLHHMYTLAIDGKSHLAPLPENITKVLDVGTGTGIWAIDFADEYPGASVIGFDLSPIQPIWIPPNVKFLVDDCTAQWLYGNDNDYVHIRTMVGCVANWPGLFKKAYDSLKPGGWLESCENNGSCNSDDGSLTSNMALYQYQFIFIEAFKKMGLNHPTMIVDDNIQRLAFEAAGFINIQERLVKIPISEWSDDPKLKEIGTFGRVALHDVEGFVGLSAVELGWTKEEIMVYAANLRRELRNPKIHPYIRVKYVWGQKPLNG